MDNRGGHSSDASEPILVSAQDPTQAPQAPPAPIVAPTAFASGSSSDACYAGSLALVPHPASNTARTAPYSARTPPPRPVFSTTPPSIADLFAAINSMQGSIHIIENSQRNMLRRTQTFEHNLTELERQVSNLDQRTARDVDELENSTRNAHERIMMCKQTCACTASAATSFRTCSRRQTQTWSSSADAWDTRCKF